MSKHTTCAIALFAIVIQSGCASNEAFVCDGITEGVRCANTRDVYEQTHDKEELRPTEAEEATQVTEYDEDEEEDYGITYVEEPATQSAKKDVKRSPQAEQRPVYPAPEPGPVIPLRTPSGVMRIAVNLWEDNQKRLFSAQYIFTEIEQRTWVIGEPYLNNKAPFSPLQNGGIETAPSGVLAPLGGN